MRNQQFLICQLMLVGIFLSQITVNLAKDQASDEIGTTQAKTEAMNEEQGTATNNSDRADSDQINPNNDTQINNSIDIGTHNPDVTKIDQESQGKPNSEITSANPIQTNEIQGSVADVSSANPIVTTENQNNNNNTAGHDENDTNQKTETNKKVDSVTGNNNASEVSNSVVPENAVQQTQPVENNSTESVADNGISSSLSGLATNKSSNETCSAMQASKDCTDRIFQILSGAQIFGTDDQNQSKNNLMNSSQLNNTDITDNLDNVPANAIVANTGGADTINPIVQNTKGNDQDCTVSPVITNNNSSDSVNPVLLGNNVQNQSLLDNSTTPDNGISSSLSGLATNSTQNETSQALSASSACSLQVAQMLSGSQMFGGFAQIHENSDTSDQISQNPNEATGNNVRQGNKI